MPVAYPPASGQRQARYLPVEAIRDLQQDPGAVAGVDLGAGRAAMLEVAQAGQAHADDVVAAPAVHVHDEGHPARVVLELGAVQAYGRVNPCASFRGSWLTGPRAKGQRWPSSPLQDRRPGVGSAADLPVRSDSRPARPLGPAWPASRRVDGPGPVARGGALGGDPADAAHAQHPPAPAPEAHRPPTHPTRVWSTEPTASPAAPYLWPATHPTPTRWPKSAVAPAARQAATRPRRAGARPRRGTTMEDRRGRNGEPPFQLIVFPSGRDGLSAKSSFDIWASSVARVLSFFVFRERCWGGESAAFTPARNDKIPDLI